MKVLLVLSLAVALATALPQGFQTRDREFGFGFGSQQQQQQRVGHSVSGFSGFGSGAVGHSAYTNCERREVSPGQFEYDCSGAAPGEIVDEKVLWVPYSGSDQNLLIRVPNYNVRDIVRAATYTDGETNENIRIHVARPQLQHVVEGQFEKSVAPAPVVQLSYEPLVQETEKVYGPPGEPFRPLSKRIDESQVVGFRRGAGFSTGSNSINSNNGFGFGGSSTFSGPSTSSFGPTRTTGFSSRPSSVVSTSFSNGNNVNNGFSSTFV